ncbi:MAG TPA: RNA-binding protein [Spirochaetota bacterium]|nr:RNA-binding protein [Spirochaetota bacterium]HPC40500.1 RNA-binding protein [Spirochaetota bacterium]HPL17434.1 RNA-binding protein [Spirochaetota bacterium]HQF07992.1 RNA-binding protein [Spirochaetota bacterium]HQH96552.1 RNA-binding protein [Spirochaetota bacterium]
MTTSRLMVENLDTMTTEKHLDNLFSTYGDIKKIRMNRNRGLGFVDMTSISEAKRACAKLDGSVLWGRSMKIQIMEDSLQNRFIYLFSRLFK